MKAAEATETTCAADLAGRLEVLVSVRSLPLVSYGLGNEFLLEKFVRIKNRLHTKPEGGLWASPIAAQYGWREWCEAESFGDLNSKFEFEYTGMTLVIDCEEDLKKVIWQETPYHRMGCPDYEALLANGVDGIWLTERGQGETRFTHPGLYGYDCECVLIMNPDCIKAR